MNESSTLPVLELPVLEGSSDYEGNETADVLGCDFDSHPKLRSVTIALGTIIAFVGCVCNLFLLVVFITKRKPRASLYLTFLAFLDFMMCIMFIQLFGLLRFSQVFEIEPLYNFLYDNNKNMMLISRIVQLSIPYVLIASSAERLVWISGRSTSSRQYWRMIGCTLIALMSFALRAPLFEAYKLIQLPGCDDYFYSKALAPTDIARTYAFWMFDFVVQFIHLFVSFVVLLLLNYLIIIKLRKTHRRARRQSAYAQVTFSISGRGAPTSAIDEETRQEHKRLRCAIRTTIVVISSYLACNSVNFVLYMVETLNNDIIFEDETGQFRLWYVFASDLGTNLFVLSSSIRLFIYYKYNPEIRNQICHVIPCELSRKHRQLRSMRRPEVQQFLLNGNGTVDSVPLQTDVPKKMDTN